MTTSVAPDYQHIVACIRQEFETLDRYLDALAPSRWYGSTACTEWNLTKLISHLTSGATIVVRTIQAGLDGAEPLSAEGRQAIWDRCDSLPPEELFPEFQQVNNEVLRYLEQLPEDKRNRRVQSFLGEVPPALLLRARLSELALHSWDARVALDPTARLQFESVGPLVDQTIDFASRRASADARARMAGSVYELDLEGRNRRRVSLSVREDGVSIQPSGGATPVATLWLTAEAFVRLAAGRFRLEQAERNGELALDGDRAAALRLNELFPGY